MQHLPASFISAPATLVGVAAARLLSCCRLHPNAPRMQTRNYWTFTVIYWALAGALMFLAALTLDHWPKVIMRFTYYPILGVVLSAAMTLVFQSASFRRMRFPIPLVLGLCLLAALITAMILNPLTYLLVGIDLREDHIMKMTRGLSEFGVAFAFWSVLYFELDGRPLLGPRSGGPGHIDRLEVDDKDGSRTVAIGEIECIEASGDYVHLHLEDQSYLRKATLSSLASLLNPDHFLRIHRSLLINIDAVIEGHHRGSGSYALTLRSGRVVHSSRSYRPAVQSLLATKVGPSVDGE